MYDFGGTLFDFLPLHVEGFAGAIESLANVGRSTLRADDLASCISGMLDEGLDSVELAASLVARFDLSVAPDELAYCKREWVELQLRDSALAGPVVEHLRWTCRQAKVRVVTLGRSESTRAILKRSLSGTAPTVYGRIGAQERVTKLELLRRAIADVAGLVAPSVLFVGDSRRDGEAASAAGCDYVAGGGLWLG